MPKSDVITVILHKKKDTQNTVRYEHPEGKHGPIPTLYVPKEVLGDKRPESIEVTIKAIEEK